MTENFDAIRPVNDTEVAVVLDRLVNNPQLIRTIIRFRFSKWPRWTYALLTPFVKRMLKNHARPLKTVEDFQHAVAPYMRRMISDTTTSFSTSGMEPRELNRPCLFISNHRDIALDPAFVNWALYTHDNPTIRIAIGDNLLSQEWVSDLMRLNKSFIVKRSVDGKREKLNASKELSAYIHHSLVNELEHIWIAQREGRAKDGNDCTNPALISMIMLNKAKTQDYAEYLDQLHVIPVSISYELDPCDKIKARELSMLASSGSYEKEDHEDIRSISKGITGQKGHVHIHFGSPLKGASSSKEMAAMLDISIQKNYRLFATNIAAARMSGHKTDSLPEGITEVDIATAEKILRKRFIDEDADVQKRALAMYAMPLLNKLKASAMAADQDSKQETK